MNGPPTDKTPQQWSVHAEFTISHPGVSDPRNPPRTGTLYDEKGVRMLYTWSANENNVNNTSWMTPNVNRSPWSAVVNCPSNFPSPRSETDRLYGFQKGNLFFTSVPPTRQPFVTVDNSSNRFTADSCNRSSSGINVGSSNRLNVNDSGYGSGLFSPKINSDTSYSRKCRSTCSIVLSNDSRTSSQRSHCGRTQSLRCQTPSACSDSKNNSFYGCGDPWCHHLHYGDDYSIARHISPVKEMCEDNAVINCTCAVCNPDCAPKQYIPDQQSAVKRDVSVQTLEMVNKCTSPMLKIDNLDKERKCRSRSAGRSKLRRGNTVTGSQPRCRQDLVPNTVQNSNNLNSSQVSFFFDSIFNI